MQMSPETAKLLIDLECPIEQKMALLKALERDWLTYQRPDLLKGAPAATPEPDAVALRKRERDRARQKLYRATDWLQLRERVFARDDFRCVYCGVDLIKSEPHCDHVVPLARGGTNDIDNLATACGPCNLAKGDRTLEQWRGAQ